jgi:hypothetical protein
VLRRAIGDNPKAAKLIRTIPGRGYEFVGAVSVRDTEDLRSSLSPIRPAFAEGNRLRSCSRRARSAIACSRCIFCSYVKDSEPQVVPSVAWPFSRSNL